MNKTEKRKRCQEIISRYSDLEFIRGEDEIFLLNLLHDHPFYKLIAGPGIDRVFVKTKRPYNTRGFWIRRVNGSVTDFVYNDCISQKITDEAALKWAMREAVGPVLWIMTDRFFEDKTVLHHCSECGQVISMENSQIVHTKKYREIARLYLIEKEKVDFSSLITEDDRYAAGYRFARKEDEKEWIEFYRQRAFYRFLCTECNFNLF